MPVPDPIIDDEVLMRVLTGAASGREQETVVAWRRVSAANEYRFREVERILDALAAHERTLLVSSPHETPFFRRIRREHRIDRIRVGRASIEERSRTAVRWRSHLDWPTAALDHSVG